MLPQMSLGRGTGRSRDTRQRRGSGFYNDDDDHHNHINNDISGSKQCGLLLHAAVADVAARLLLLLGLVLDGLLELGALV